MEGRRLTGTFNIAAAGSPGMDAADRFFLAVVLLIFLLIGVGTLLAVL